MLLTAVLGRLDEYLDKEDWQMEGISKTPLQHGDPRNLSIEEIDKILSHAILGRVATSADNQPHVVPVWFIWDGDSLWFESSTKAKKTKNLMKNPNCMVTVDDTFGGLRFWAILLKGKAELFREPDDFVRDMVTRIYTKYLGEEGVLAPQPQEMIFAEHVLVKLKPSNIITWDTTQSPLPPVG
jgi:nitroimidazol reductase NimA-like FMN-containing flavoprotein (pyridoxamine 5'-phosphate oxidase superfamily)